MREIKLQSDVSWPLHALQLPGDRFVVSHGWVGPLQRVCLVDSGGKVTLSFGTDEAAENSSDSRRIEPRQLAVDSQGSVMVADRENNRIIVLDSRLNWIRDLAVSDSDVPTMPLAMCLDESRGRLFVVVFGGRVLVFDKFVLSCTKRL